MPLVITFRCDDLSCQFSREYELTSLVTSKKSQVVDTGNIGAEIQMRMSVMVAQRSHKP